MEALSCVDRCCIGGETLNQLPSASQVGQTRVGGIDLNKRRMRWVAQAVLALAATPHGLTTSDLACQVQRLKRPIPIGVWAASSSLRPEDVSGQTARAPHGMHGVFHERGVAA